MLKSLLSTNFYVFFTIFQLYFAHLIYADHLELSIEEFLEQSDINFNGVILITQNENILYQTVKESIDFEEKSPLDEDSQFIIGSNSKQITSVLILRALDAGLLDLNIPIKNYLPELNDRWAKDVHLHHLLNHSSGFEDVNFPLNFEPGEKFSYSNRGYNLIGKILERIMNKSYETLVKELFQAECGLFNTMALSSGSLADLKLIFPKLVIGFIESEKASIIDVEHNPCSGIISTVYDLWAWNTALHEGQLLSEESYTLMTTPWMERNHRWGKIGYGYGLQISYDEGIKEIGHNGFMPVYTSTLLYYPNEKINVILLEKPVLNLPVQKGIFYVQDNIRDIVRDYILRSKE